MAKIYLSLIRKGRKTLDDVPEQLREEVRALLEAEEAKTAPETEQEYPDITVPDELDSGYTVPVEEDETEDDFVPAEDDPEITDDLHDGEDE